MIRLWKFVNPPFGQLEATAKMKSNQVLISSRASANCSFFQCLFSTPVSFSLIRSMTPRRSSWVKNCAFNGLSGRRKRIKTPQDVVIAPQIYQALAAVKAFYSPLVTKKIYLQLESAPPMCPIPKLAIPAMMYPIPAEPTHIPKRKGCSLRL